MAAAQIEKQLRDWTNQLAPEHKQILLRLLTEDETFTQAARLAFAEQRLRQLAETRQLQWDSLTKSAREKFLDGLLQEDELYATRVGNSTDLSATTTCFHCGHTVTAADLARIYFGEAALLAPAPDQPREPTLIVQDIESGAMEFGVAAEGETIIGRFDPHRGIRPAVDLSKYDPASRVSRRHARIVAQQGVFHIEDLGSANGTILNGRTRLKPQMPMQLSNNDLVKIGETTLKFVC